MSGRDGREVFNALLREGIIVRHIEGRMLRVTIGLPDENQLVPSAHCRKYMRVLDRGKRDETMIIVLRPEAQ